MGIEPKSELHTINSSTPQLRTSTTSGDRQKAATIALLLSKLAVHYYRPDFTEAQAKSMISDMVSDLEEFPVHYIEAAIREYRRDPNSRFFPTSGQLRKICSEHRKEENEARGKERIKFQFGEGRPLFWWLKPRAQWAKHWRENDIPLDEVRRWHGRCEAMKAKGVVL